MWSRGRSRLYWSLLDYTCRDAFWTCASFFSWNSGFFRWSFRKLISPFQSLTPFRIRSLQPGFFLMSVVKRCHRKKATDNHNQWLLLEFGTLCVLALTWIWRLNTARFLFMLWPSSQWLRVPFATARSYEISGTYIPTGTETLKDFWSCFQTPGFTLWTGFLDWPMRLHEILSEGPKSFSIELRMLRNTSASLLCATSEMVI